MKEFCLVLEKKERSIVGMMSGTSLDGVDLALVHFEGSGLETKMKLEHFRSYPMPEDWRRRIQRAFSADTAEICRINFDAGFFFGELILRFLYEIGTDAKEVDAIGFHGQTLFHVDRHSTLQTGDADVVARLTGTVVVHDFRAADIAAGGSGAPLVPYFDRILFKDRRENIILQNIGGISNLTFLPGDPNEPVIAFDTGPGNAILNEMTEIITEGKRHFDEDAFLSSQGVVQPDLLSELLDDRYFSLNFPKSTGREDFGRDYARNIMKRRGSVSARDLLRTFASLVSHSIACSIKRCAPGFDRVYLSGGGACHPIILAELRELLGEDKVSVWKGFNGITADSKEAAAFALLAHERLNDAPANIPSVTGAESETALGKIAVPYQGESR